MHATRVQLCGAWLALCSASASISLACEPIGGPHPAVNFGTNAVAPGDASTPTLPSAATEPAQPNDELDPNEVLHKLVDRYHRLVTYKDSVRMVQTTQREGETAATVESHLTCQIN